MTAITKAARQTSLILLTGTSLFLAGCEIRRDGAEDATTPDALATPDTGSEGQTPEPEASTTTASIIRDEMVPAEPVEQEAAADPVEMILPMPDGADISPEVERMLLLVLQSDAIAQDWPIVLGGHTDSSGNDLANLRASRARAEAVAAWLVEHGVADARIEVIAFGEQNPLAPNARPDGSPDEQARRRNRRVELRIGPSRSVRQADEETSQAEL